MSFPILGLLILKVLLFLNAQKKKSKIYIIDTSAILSGIPINFDDAAMVTTSSISMELKPGGRDYRAFQFLIEKGLSILSPSKKSRDAVNSASSKTGDKDRLSKADVDVLALALDMKLDDDKAVTDGHQGYQEVVFRFLAKR